MANANLFAGYLQPPKSVFDYQQQLGQIDMGDAQVAQARQATQAQAAQLQRDEADRNAFADIMRQSGGDQTQAMKAMLSSPNVGLYQRGVAAQKAQLDATETQAKIKKETATAEETDLKARGLKRLQAMQDISALPDARAAVASILSKIKSGELPEDAGVGLIQGAMTAPDFGKWRDSVVMRILASPDAQLQADATANAPTVHQKEFKQYKAEELAAGRVPKTFEQYTESQRKAAAAKGIDLKIDTKLGESVAGQIGPMLRESYEQATGSQQQLATADQLIKAVESGKLLTGPGATLRLRALQVGQALGVGGKDDAEVISNTRAAIQGLAQSTLAARGALKGQGQVSDNEGKLLERAASGAVDDLTGPEIKQIAQTNKKLAQQLIALHAQRVAKARANPATAGISDFYDIVTPDSPTPPPAPSRPGRAVIPKPAGSPASSAAPTPPAGVDPALWGVMTPQERALWPK